ncbi:Zinc finger BED domain-containing protein 1 [Merluccius polli]|uniref:Zinc finger BED domain-containing protein 1 n=1 Tax=Merluccius polli TaxID=89951 RepID=A0AA47M6V4_MERPO|nr:Zinc finger BED domain-containing protein 1 [Merluccius polli]
MRHYPHLLAGAWGLGLLCWLSEVWLYLGCSEVVTGAASFRWLLLAFAVLPPPLGTTTDCRYCQERAGAGRWLSINAAVDSSVCPGSPSVSLPGWRSPMLGTRVAVDFCHTFGFCWAPLTQVCSLTLPQSLISLTRARAEKLRQCRKVWIHFGFKTIPGKTELDMTKAVCKLCHGQISYCGNTTNMSAHLNMVYNLIPSRKFFSETAIPKLYHEVKSGVKEKLSRAERVALTCDAWTSQATESHVTLTAHYIAEDWSLSSHVLQTRAMSECHTGANIAELLRNVAAEWDISEKDAALVTGNAANMAVAAQLAGFLHIKCYAHTLNLASQRALKLPAVARLLGRKCYSTQTGTGSGTTREVSFWVVKDYSTAASLPLSENPLDWWKDHHREYPLLAKLAKQYLCVPGTSVSAEHVFSTAGDIVTAQRSTLTDIPMRSTKYFLKDKEKRTYNKGMATFPRKSALRSRSSSRTVTSRTAWMSFTLLAGRTEQRTHHKSGDPDVIQRGKGLVWNSGSFAARQRTKGRSILAVPKLSRDNVTSREHGNYLYSRWWPRQ